MTEGIIDLYSFLTGGVTGASNSVDPYSPISFPINFPSVSGVRAITWGAKFSGGISESEFTFHRQVQMSFGERWEITVELPPMKRAHAAEWESFLLMLATGGGTVLFGDVFNPTPRGFAYGAPVINGAISKLASTVSTRGWQANVEGILKAGDKIQIGNALHSVKRDANSDGSGVAVLDIFPRLRDFYADGVSIVTNEARGRFQLSGSGGSFSKTDVSGFYFLNSFQLVEAF